MALMTTENITQADAAHVLWFFGDNRGWEPGGFRGALLEAYSRADQENRGRLAIVYPGLAEAFEVGQHTMGGIETLAEFMHH